MNTNFGSNQVAGKAVAGSRGHVLLALAGCLLLPIGQVEAASCHIFQVQLHGSTAIGSSTSMFPVQNFQVMQYAVVRDAGYNNTHSVEVLLTTGKDIHVSPNVGEIELMTNSAFANNAGIKMAHIDLATVSQGNGLSFNIDGAASYRQPSPNVFVAPGYNSTEGGLGGVCYLNDKSVCNMLKSQAVLSVSYLVPRAGQASFAVRGGMLNGEIMLAGSSLDNPNFGAQYRAMVAGRYMKTVPCD
jgi:hypothetical protein